MPKTPVRMAQHHSLAATAFEHLEGVLPTDKPTILDLLFIRRLTGCKQYLLCLAMATPARCLYLCVLHVMTLHYSSRRSFQQFIPHLHQKRFQRELPVDISGNIFCHLCRIG